MMRGLIRFISELSCLIAASILLIDSMEPYPLEDHIVD